MANLYVMNPFLAPALANLLSNFTGTWSFRLFQNNVTIDRNKVIGDLTEANFTGYASISPSWSTAAYDGVQYATSTSQALVWVWTGGSAQTLYGAYIYDSGGNLLIAAFNFAAPITVDAGNPIVAALFTVRLSSEF